MLSIGDASTGVRVPSWHVFVVRTKPNEVSFGRRVLSERGVPGAGRRAKIKVGTPVQPPAAQASEVARAPEPPGKHAARVA